MKNMLKQRLVDILKCMSNPDDRASFSRDELVEIATLLGALEPDPLRVARADKAKDVRHLTAEDATLDALRLIREHAAEPGKDVRLVLLWEVIDREHPDENPAVRWSRMARVTKSIAMSMMEWAKYDIMHGVRQ